MKKLLSIVALLSLTFAVGVGSSAQHIDHPHRDHVTERYDDPGVGLFVQLQISETQTLAINEKVQALTAPEYAILRNVSNAAVFHLNNAIVQFEEAYDLTLDHTVNMQEVRQKLNSPNARVFNDMRAIESIKQSMLYLIILEGFNVFGNDDFRALMEADPALSNNYTSAMFYQNEAWVTANAILWHVVDSMISEDRAGVHPLPQT